MAHDEPNHTDQKARLEFIRSTNNPGLYLDHFIAKAGFNVDLMGVTWTRIGTISTLVAVAMSLDAWNLAAAFNTPPSVRYLAFGLTGASLILLLWSVWHLIKAGQTQYTADPYKFESIADNVARYRSALKQASFSDEEAAKLVDQHERFLVIANWIEVSDQLQTLNGVRLHYTKSATWKFIFGLTLGWVAFITVTAATPGGSDGKAREQTASQAIAEEADSTSASSDGTITTTVADHP